MRINRFIKTFTKNNSIRYRGFIQNFDSTVYSSSCINMDKINKNIRKSSNFDNHEAVFFECGKDYMFAVFVHNTNRGLSQGGARFYNEYKDIYELIDDGLRLSKGMTYKNALAGLDWGGGKGIICAPNKTPELLQKYGCFISSLNGCYYTAEDVGLNTEDVTHIYNKCRYTTCIPEVYGGSGNPSMYTAKGVVTAIDTVLNNRDERIEDMTVGIEGLGNVGKIVLEEIIDRNPKKIVVSETN